MVIQALVFYLFAALLIGSGIMVVTARNPVHSVLFLVLAFFNGAGLFLLAGAEFLAMILVIVYVGAVMVLFLFVVMMLDINFLRMREGVMKYLPAGATIGLILLAELVVLAVSWAMAPEAIGNAASPAKDGLSNVKALGMILYTDYLYLFQAAGLVLLVAMIGAIQLSMRKRAHVRKQKVAEQLSHNKDNSLEVRKVSSGGGI